MSLLAGIYSRERDDEIPSQFVEALAGAITRVAGHKVDIYRQKNVCLIKLDVGTYGDRAYTIASDGAMAMMTGDPVLRIEGHSNSCGRSAALERLHESIRRDESDDLCLTTGQFSLALYTPATRTIKLISDKLGLRQLYYWDGSRFFIFASALRILEAIPEVPLRLDLRAVTEILNFGYALGSRTPYADVRALGPAEILSVTDRSVTKKQYWRIDEVKYCRVSTEEKLDELHLRFMTAVKLRLRNDHTAVALLSGGLDSRCVVAALRAENADVHTINCSTPGTQDQVFAAAFAEKTGSIHRELNAEVGDPNIFNILEDMLGSTTLEPSPEHRSLLWAGNDGSLSLGHVFLTPEQIRLLRQGNLDQAIDAFLRHRQFLVISKLFVEGLAEQMSQVLREGLRQELLDLHCEDPARNLWSFLILTNMRKHFRTTIEDIDRHRLEFQLPFLDTDFLSAIIGIPIDMCLLHEFYTQWLNWFEPTVTSVPWQTYPGHRPCPVMVPDRVQNQWERSRYVRKAERKEGRRELIRQTSEMLRGKLPVSVINEHYLKFAYFAYVTRFHDYSYLLRVALDYWKYILRAGGIIRMPL